MCMTSRGRNDIWPSLVEKAVCMRSLACYTTCLILFQYLKLMGGYDFPGSCVSSLLVYILWLRLMVFTSEPQVQIYSASFYTFVLSLVSDCATAVHWPGGYPITSKSRGNSIYYFFHLHHIHIVPFHSPSFQREQLWSRLSRGFKDGSHITSAHTSRS